MLNLNNIASGITNTGCGNSNLPVTQKVEIVPYSNTASCGTESPINASRVSTGITVKNMIVDKCGIIRIFFDHDASASDDQLVPFGGPISLSTRATLNPWYNRWDLAAGSLATFPAGPTVAAGTTAGYDAAVLILNEYAQKGNAIIITNVSMTRADLSNLDAAELANNPITPFYVNNSSTYKVETSGASIYSSQTSVGSSNTAVDIMWCLGAGIPLSMTTGFELSIPGGFEGNIDFCVGAAQSNIDFSEGC